MHCECMHVWLHTSPERVWLSVNGFSERAILEAKPQLLQEWKDYVLNNIWLNFQFLWIQTLSFCWMIEAKLWNQIWLANTVVKFWDHWNDHQNGLGTTEDLGKLLILGFFVMFSWVLVINTSRSTWWFVEFGCFVHEITIFLDISGRYL